MERTKIAIVIPALNEEKTIGKIIKELSAYGKIIVVNDGSEDFTNKIASDAGAFVINHESNLGYDKALNSGCEYLSKKNFKYFITLDADGQHSAKYIPSYIKYLKAGYKIVVGNRSRQARLGELIYSFIIKTIWQINDPLCGMKGYSGSLLNEQGYFDSYQSIGTELLFFALKKKYKVKQVKIDVKSRIGKSRFGSKITSNLKIFRSLFISLFKML